jgi:hypothetical protein
MEGRMSNSQLVRARLLRSAVYIGVAVLAWAVALGAYLVSADAFWLSLGLLAASVTCIAVSAISYIRLLIRSGQEEANRSVNMKPMVFAFGFAILAVGILIGKTEGRAPTWKLGAWLFSAVYLCALILPLARWREWGTGEYFHRADRSEKKNP